LTVAAELAGRILLRLAIPHSQPASMIETNPIHARIADLKDRVASLRGYL
jgi:hypothetical protein